MDIFERNYKAVVNRGLITPKTTNVDFYVKLKEEVNEVLQEIEPNTTYKLNEEIADCLVVCANWLIFNGCNIEEILTQIAEKNEKRAKQ